MVESTSELNNAQIYSTNALLDNATSTDLLASHINDSKKMRFVIYVNNKGYFARTRVI